MRFVASIALLGGALVAAPLLGRLPVSLAALSSIAVGVALAVLVSGARWSLAVATGALAALAFHGLAGHSPVLAGTAFVALLFVPRAVRARTRAMRMVHGVAGALAGALASLVAIRHGGDTTVAVRTAAVGVAGLLASWPLALPVDDLVAHDLAVYARELSGETGERMSRAVSLRRRVVGSPAVEALVALTRRRVEQAWQALVELAAQRVGAASAVVPVLDRRIEQYIEGLERVHAAVDERFACIAGLSDGRLVAASVEAETIEGEVRALVEVASQGSTPVSAREGGTI